jgi:hypothetical protein
VRVGGLMRCCLETLDDAMQQAQTPPVEGQRLRCKVCDDAFGMLFHHGVAMGERP